MFLFLHKQGFGKSWLFNTTRKKKTDYNEVTCAEKSFIKPMSVESLPFTATRCLVVPLSAISINCVSFGEQAFGIMSLK